MLPAPDSSSKLLLNRTILVACSAKKMVELAAGLQAMGGSVLPFPAIEPRALEDKHLLDQALASLRGYSWIIFTSEYGVRFFMQRMDECEIRLDTQSPPKICTIGPATTRALKEFGYETHLMPKHFVAEGVLDALGRYHGGIQHVAGQRFLLPRAKEARALLPDTLTAAGAQVDVVPCYQTVQAEIDPDIVKRCLETRPDLMVFTSSSTIQYMVEIFGSEAGERMLLESTIAVIGPITAKTAESFGKRVEIVPKQNTIAALIEAIRQYYIAADNEH